MPSYFPGITKCKIPPTVNNAANRPIDHEGRVGSDRIRFHFRIYVESARVSFF
jgi:hypothetical protein